MMKKVNKKLASAIVLGLMMAVPFSASAANNSIDTGTAGYVSNIDKDYKGSDITFTYKGADIEDGHIADADGPNKNVTFENAGTIKLDSDYWNNAFLGASGGVLDIKDIDSIITINEEYGDYNVFHAYNGEVKINNVNDINLGNVYNALYAQRDNTAKDTTNASIDVDVNNNVILGSNVNIVAANYSKNNNSTDDGKGVASVDIDANNVIITRTDKISSDDIAYKGYAISSNSKDYDKKESDDLFSGKTSVNISADMNIEIYADLNDEYGAIYAYNGKSAGDASVTLNAKNIIIEGDIVADKNAYVGVTATTSANIDSDIVATDSNVDFNLGNGSFTGAIDNTGSTVNVTGGEGSSAVFGGSVAGDGVTAVRADQGGTVNINVDNISVEAGERTYTNVFMAIQDTVVSEDPEKRANITINADNITGKYETAQDMNVFKAWGGDIDVTAGNIYFDNVDVGFAAETFNGASADLTVTANNIYMSTVGGEAAHARIDSTGKTTAKTELTATGDITLVSNTTNDRATVSVYQNENDKISIANSNSSISLNAGGTLTIENNTKDGNAIYVENAEGENLTSVTAQGTNVVIKGNIEATDNTSVVVGNDDYSSVINFTGAINDSNDYDKETEGVTFNMKNGSVWNVTGNSRVRSIDGVGTIKLDVSDTEAMDTVEIDDAKDADLTIAAQQNADDVKDANAALEAMAGAVDGVNDGTVVKVEEGILKGETSGTLVTGENGNSVADVHQNDTTTTMGNMRDLASVALVAWRQEDSTLSQRLGELRNSEGDQGIWARMSRGEFEYDGAFKNQYNYFQLGYDWANGDWHYGAAISHNDGQTTYANGSGENDSTSLTLYGTWLGDKGQYTDIVVKQGKLNNEFTNYADAGVTSADYDMWGTSISAEYGQKLDLNNDWYVTPQAQLTYMVIGSEDYTATVDGAPMQVSQDSMDSVVGRVGFEAGKHISDKGSIYAKASLLHEFAGEADTYMQLGETTNSYTQDLGDTWYECGIGVNYKTSDNSYVYADVVKTFGGDVETPWQWNAGMRFTF